MIILHFFHIFNKNYDSESGTKFISTDLHGGPFLHFSWPQPTKLIGIRFFFQI